MDTIQRVVDCIIQKIPLVRQRKKKKKARRRRVVYTCLLSPTTTTKTMARKRNSNDDNNHKESTLHPLLLFPVTSDLARENPLSAHRSHRRRRLHHTNVILSTHQYDTRVCIKICMYQPWSWYTFGINGTTSGSVFIATVYVTPNLKRADHSKLTGRLKRTACKCIPLQLSILIFQHGTYRYRGSNRNYAPARNGPSLPEVVLTLYYIAVG